MFTIFKSKKRILLFLFFVCFGFIQNMSVFAKEEDKQEFVQTEVDCIFSVGSACRPAQYLREHGFRFQAAPLDWMMKYSLETVSHLIETKFTAFFEKIEKIPNEICGNHIAVKDTKNEITSVHHFKKDNCLEEEHKKFREMMLGRANKVDEIFKKSDSIGLICNRQKTTLKEFKRFIRKFSKVYPKKKITLINIRSDDVEGMVQNVLFESKNKNLKILEFVFLESDAKWTGNADAWKEVMSSIKLRKKIFKNLYNIKAEF